jgi:CBS domain-containing protein
MNVAAILKQKGRGVFTTAPDTSLLEITKLLGMHGIGCIVITGADGKVSGMSGAGCRARNLATGLQCSKTGRAVHNEGRVTCREAETIDHLMAQMTAHRFTTPWSRTVDRIISIGGVVKWIEAEMEAAAMREYIATG